MAEYGQQPHMEDPSMVGTLRAQAEMIWPKEWPLLESLGMATLAERDGAPGQVLDLGCGTGEFAGRLASRWPALVIRGYDLFPRYVALAREAYPAEQHPRLTFEVGDALDLDEPAGMAEVVTLRHFLHALPDPDAVLAESFRVLRPGGLVYTLAEDYQGIVIDAPSPARSLFEDGRPHVASSGTDLHHGRTAFRRLRGAGFVDVRVASLVIDTSNTPREPFARMLRHWRDGYAGFLGPAMGIGEPEARARFDTLIQAVEDEDRYAGWWLLAVSGRVPGPRA